MSLLVPEIASEFYTLDSDAAFADGDLPDAALIRVLSMAANRQLARADEPLINEIWDSAGDGTEVPVGGFCGFGWPIWLPILAGPSTRVKKPGLTSAKLFVRAQLQADAVVLVQVCSRGASYNPLASSTSINVLKMEGTGSWEDYELDGIPIDAGEIEQIEIRVRGANTSTPANTGVYGSPNTGTVTGFESTIMHAQGATWNLTGNTLANGGHGIAFEDGSGNQLASAQWIVLNLPQYFVPPATPTASDRLVLYPGIANENIRASLIGQTFRIFELPRWRFCNLALYPNDREAA